MVVAAKLSRYPDSIGDGECRHSRAGLHQQRIDMPVIAALELERQVAAGESAGDAKSAHRRLGAGIHQANQFHARLGSADKLGELDFAFRRRSETGADLEYSLQRVDHRLRAMAEKQRSPGTDVVDIAVPIDVDQPRSFASGDESRCSADPGRPERASSRLRALLSGHERKALLSANCPRQLLSRQLTDRQQSRPPPF